MPRFVPGHLNANELLQRAGFQELVRSSISSRRHTKMTESFRPIMLKCRDSRSDNM